MIFIYCHIIAEISSVFFFFDVLPLKPPCLSTLVKFFTTVNHRLQSSSLMYLFFDISETMPVVSFALLPWTRHVALTTSPILVGESLFLFPLTWLWPRHQCYLRSRQSSFLLMSSSRDHHVYQHSFNSLQPSANVYNCVTLCIRFFISQRQYLFSPSLCCLQIGMSLWLDISYK